MATAETRRRLRWHAGFEDVAGRRSVSVSESTESGDADLETAVDDVITTLEALNHEVNGNVPSETAASARTISTDIAYAVAEISRMLRSYEERAADGRGAEAAWMVDTAWLAVLAGDIDDVEEHVAEERRAR